METLQIEVTQIVPAPVEDVYAVIADYRVGHPTILPKSYFKTLTVEEGGFGAGTVIRLTMEVFGQRFDYLLTITEPEPGRVLVEKDQLSELETTFLLEPVEDDQQTRVTIRSHMPVSDGLQGMIQRLIQPRITAHIYRKELHLLDDYLHHRLPANRMD